MAFTAVYDACILYPISLRDLFVRLGQTGLFRAKWTKHILDEFVSALLRARPAIEASLVRQREQMRAAIRDAEVMGYEELLPSVPPLPDPGDAHVVAAAMKSGAQVIVTFNLKDFPESVLEPLGIEAQHPDTFVRHLIDLDRVTVADVVDQMAAAKVKPAMTYDEVLVVLDRRGLVKSAKALQRR